MGRTLEKGPNERKVTKGKASEKAMQVDKTLKAACEIKDMMAFYPAFQHYNRQQMSVNLPFMQSTNLDPGTFQWTFDLCKHNMQELYEASWGWNDRKKKQELKHDDARFIIAERTHDQEEATKDPAAYIHFRFEKEDGDPMLYVYELQLEKACQGKGLGKFLMKMMELVAFQLGMQAIMLTVQQANSSALAFYEKLGYMKHHSCPSQNALDNPGYVILHKLIPQRREVSQRQAAPSH